MSSSGHTGRLAQKPGDLEDKNLPYRKIVGVGVASLVIFGLGIVNQRLFSLDQRAAQKRLQQMNRLNTYGWLDRPSGVAHVPIDVAMDMLVQEQKK